MAANSDHQTAGDELEQALDALLSPQIPSFEDTRNSRESVAESDLEDDTRFSTVTLSSTDAGVPESEDSDLESLKPSPRSSMTLAEDSATHKKSSSITTIRSSRRLSIPLDEETPAKDAPTLNRVSLDGQMKLKEEFERLHREKEREDEASTSPANAGAIDWGAWLILSILSGLTPRLKSFGELLWVVG